MTNSSDSILRLYDTTNDMMNSEDKENVEIVNTSTPYLLLFIFHYFAFLFIKACSLKLEEPEIIYDYAW